MAGFRGTVSKDALERSTKCAKVYQREAVHPKPGHEQDKDLSTAANL